MDSRTGKSTGWEGAYNGTVYQTFEHDGLQLDPTLPSDFTNRFHANQPIVEPLGFAFGDGDPIHYLTLLNAGTWERLVPKSEHVGTEELNGRLCDVVEVRQVRTHFNSEFVYRVFLDRGYEYYPVRWHLEVVPRQAPDGSPGHRAHTEGSVTILERETSDGRVLIPIAVQTNMYDGDNKFVQSAETRIDPATLRVNELIDEALFTIDPARATAGIADARTKAVRQPLEAQPESRVIRRVVFAVLALLIASLVGWLYWQERRRKRPGNS